MPTQLLLADDSPTIAKILQMSLQNEPYEIRAVLTAEEALRELRANPPALFLVDLTLPGKNGYEFARFIKQDHKLAQVRVVLLSSAFDPVDENELKACGADGVVKKPFDPSELRERLRSILSAPASAPGAGLLSPDSAPPPSSPDDLALPAASAEDDIANLLQGNLEAPTGAGADEILAGLLSPGSDALPIPEADASPAELESVFHAPAAESVTAEQPEGFEPTREKPAPAATAPAEPLDLIPTREEPTPTGGNPTVALDLSGQMESSLSGEAVLDLSSAFNTPPGGTAVINMDQFGFGEAAAAPVPPPVASAPAPSPPAPKTPTPPAAQAAEEDLSANAQALAAFFDAEITKGTAKPAAQAPAPKATPPAPPPQPAAAPPPPEADSFDASLDSIDWGASGPAEASLSGWSSGSLKAKMPEDPVAAAPVTTAPAKPAPATRHASASATVKADKASKTTTTLTRRLSTGSPTLMFDTGGSNFRFADDYITRITKSFTGGVDEDAVPEKAAPSPLFPSQSDDRPAASPAASAAAPSALAGGGAWSAQDVERIERIVREEVQMVVREVAEKVAWEVIPELAENLIRQELDKVLKELEQ